MPGKEKGKKGGQVAILTVSNRLISVSNHKLKQTAHAKGGFSHSDGSTRVWPLLSVTFGGSSRGVEGSRHLTISRKPDETTPMKTVWHQLAAIAAFLLAFAVVAYFAINIAVEGLIWFQDVWATTVVPVWLKWSLAAVGLAALLLWQKVSGKASEPPPSCRFKLDYKQMSMVLWTCPICLEQHSFHRRYGFKNAGGSSQCRVCSHQISLPTSLELIFILLKGYIARQFIKWCGQRKARDGWDAIKDGWTGCCGRVAYVWERGWSRIDDHHIICYRCAETIAKNTRAKVDADRQRQREEQEASPLLAKAAKARLASFKNYAVAVAWLLEHQHALPDYVHVEGKQGGTFSRAIAGELVEELVLSTVRDRLQARDADRVASQIVNKIADHPAVKSWHASPTFKLLCEIMSRAYKCHPHIVRHLDEEMAQASSRIDYICSPAGDEDGSLCQSVVPRLRRSISNCTICKLYIVG